jgi:hypothetical protein
MLKCLKQRANKVVVQFSIMQKGLDYSCILSGWIDEELNMWSAEDIELTTAYALHFSRYNTIH